MQPHRATLILVLGILSLIVCQPLGIVAWIMGNNDLDAMKNGQMNPEGRDLTNVGRICGIIATVIFALSIIAFVLFLLLGGGIAALSAAGASAQ